MMFLVFSCFCVSVLFWFLSSVCCLSFFSITLFLYLLSYFFLFSQPISSCSTSLLFVSYLLLAAKPFSSSNLTRESSIQQHPSTLIKGGSGVSGGIERSGRERSSSAGLLRLSTDGGTHIIPPPSTVASHAAAPFSPQHSSSSVLLPASNATNTSSIMKEILNNGSKAWEEYMKGNDSIISNAFQGQLCTHVLCDACGKSSTRFEPFTTLSLPIPKAFINNQANSSMNNASGALGNNPGGTEYTFIIRFYRKMPRFSVYWKLRQFLSLVAEKEETISEEEYDRIQDIENDENNKANSSNARKVGLTMKDIDECLLQSAFFTETIMKRREGKRFLIKGHRNMTVEALKKQCLEYLHSYYYTKEKEERKREFAEKAAEAEAAVERKKETLEYNENTFQQVYSGEGNSSLSSDGRPSSSAVVNGRKEAAVEEYGTDAVIDLRKPKKTSSTTVERVESFDDHPSSSSSSSDVLRLSRRKGGGNDEIIESKRQKKKVLLPTEVYPDRLNYEIKLSNLTMIDVSSDEKYRIRKIVENK
jgi:hypothetical protein